MKNFIYVIYIAVLLHSLGAMVGAVGCLLSSQLGLSLIFLVMSFVFFIIARKYEKLWKALQ